MVNGSTSYVRSRVSRSLVYANSFLTACHISCCFKCTGSKYKEFERRESRRYCASNTQGRHAHAQIILQKLKTLPHDEAVLFFSRLLPRDRLDMLRLVRRKRGCCDRAKNDSPLRKYRSKLFRRSYFFEEKDIQESSTLGRGPGGQATNRRKQTVIIKHIPSGLIVKYSHFPSLWLNRVAARNLLNLRLEEFLLGKDSELGRSKAREQLRNERRASIVKHLSKKGQKMRTISQIQRRVYDFHCNLVSLPERVLFELDEPYFRNRSSKSVLLRDFYDKEHHRLWHFIITAFASVNNRSHLCETVDDNGQYTLLAIPEFLRFLFPTVDGESTEQADNYNAQQMQLCSSSETVRDSVCLALRNVCELYGLRLTTANTRSGNSRPAILRDKTLWRERRARMYHNETKTALAVALTLWTHVYTSLIQLKMNEYATALYEFFHRHAHRVIEGNTDEVKWASTILRSLAHTHNRISCAHAVEKTKSFKELEQD